MGIQRQNIAKAVADRLFAAEAAIDIAVARIAELNAALPLARIEARVAAAVGQDAIASSASAVVLMAQARAQIIATHANLKQASDEVGLQELSYGDLLKPPEKHRLTSVERLRAA